MRCRCVEHAASLPALLSCSCTITAADVGLDKWLCATLILAAEATVKLPKIRGLNVSSSR
jgi:hypothetical protein